MQGAASHRKRNAVILAAVALAVLLADQASKAYFETFRPGEVAGTPIPGVLGFRLVHNTGAAWGALSDMTGLLAVLSVVICVVVVAYLFVLAPESSALTAFACALVLGGGIGNLIDRMTRGYVVDFLDALFMDFPVFNIADVGVTCGVALFFVACVLEWRRDAARTEAASSADVDHAEGGR